MIILTLEFQLSKNLMGATNCEDANVSHGGGNCLVNLTGLD